MSRPVASTPYLPNAGRANDVWQLNAFDQDLNKALFAYLSELARRVNGSLPKDGQEAMTGPLNIQVTDDASLSSTLNALTLGLITGLNIAFDNNEIQARNNGAASTLHLNTDGGDIETNVNTAGVFKLNGGQLQFPATQVPSSGANVLDDYEEGTWTPTVTFGGGSTGITYTTQRGSYIKIGKFVLLDFEILLSSKGSSTGTTLIGSMPFSTATNRPGNGIIGFYSGMAFPAGTLGNTTLSYGGTDFNVRYYSNTTTTLSNDTHWTNTSRLIGTFIYLAAS